MASPNAGPASGRRRRVLRSVAGVALAALAGCAGDQSAATTTTPATTTATTGTTTPTTTETTATTVAPEVQRETALRLTRLLGDGEFGTAHGLLSANVREQFSVADLRSAWEQTTGDLGAFAGASGVERTTAQGYDVLLVRAQFEAGVLTVPGGVRGRERRGPAVPARAGVVLAARVRRPGQLHRAHARPRLAGLRTRSDNHRAVRRGRQ